LVCGRILPSAEQFACRDLVEDGRQLVRPSLRADEIILELPEETTPTKEPAAK